MSEQQVKSRERVTAHGEVFTAAREVNAMLDLVKNETERLESLFLEPACGDGNFLAEILRRKLAVALRESIPPRRKKPAPEAYEFKSLLALMSIYGVELLEDNVTACRERLYGIWGTEYAKACNRPPSKDCATVAHFVLERNIICGNALTMKNDNGGPLVFSHWGKSLSGRIKRTDWTFAEILEEREKEQKIIPDAIPLKNGSNALPPNGLFDSPSEGNRVAQFPPVYYLQLPLAKENA